MPVLLHEDLLYCADLGGSSIKVGLVAGRTLIRTRRFEVGTGLSWNEALASIERWWHQMAAEVTAKSRPAMVGLALPCVIQAWENHTLSALDKFDGATDCNIDAWANERFGCPAIVENDANAALAGEWDAGAGRDCDNLALLILGTGVGTAAIVEGRPLRGHSGSAGCLSGHLSLRLDGRRCKCGNVGCAEAEASGWSLPALALQAPEYRASQLRSEPKLTVEVIHRLATAGDQLAKRLWNGATHVWGAAALNLIHAYDPERLIVSGGIASSGKSLLVPVRSYVEKHQWRGARSVPIVVGELGDKAALLGLACLARYRSQRGAQP